jgi:hypothetical protein
MIARHDEARATKVYWSPFSRLSVGLQMLLLLTDKSPEFVALNPADAKTDKHAIV